MVKMNDGVSKLIYGTIFDTRNVEYFKQMLVDFVCRKSENLKIFSSEDEQMKKNKIKFATIFLFFFFLNRFGLTGENQVAL